MGILFCIAKPEIIFKDHQLKAISYPYKSLDKFKPFPIPFC